MIDYSFTYGNLEFWLLIFVRVTAFVTVAPLVGGQNTGVTNTAKVMFAAFLSVLLIGVVPRTEVVYSSVFGYAAVVIKEALCGAIIGFGAQICIQAAGFAGQIVDMMTGLSMVTMMDPSSGNQVTITGTIYNQVIMVMLIVSGMYRFMLSAIADSYHWLPVNGLAIHSEELISAMAEFLKNYIVIGFRIALPIFIVTFITNFILGILAKVAPQMNMFAVGIQIKILSGLAVLYVSSRMLGSAADFILRNMEVLIERFINAMRV